MADATHIEWTDATWNVVTGCSVVSPGCTNCYAMKLAGTRLKHHPSRAGLTVDSKAGPVWNGQVRFNAEWLTQPLRWTRPRRIFVAAHGDLFHDGVTDDQLDQIWAVMALGPQHTFQILTKRAERMRAYLASEDIRARIAAAAWDLSATLPGRGGDRFAEAACRMDQAGGPRWPLPNVWLGVSVEDQTRADERIPALLSTPAAVRWISAEPLLGPVNLDHVKMFDHATPGGGREAGWESALDGRRYDPWNDEGGETGGHPKLDWVVAGGESGPDARPMHPDWARQLRDQCAAAGVAFLFKQWGAWVPVCALDDDQADRLYHPRPARDPEATRRCRVAKHTLQRDGSRHGPSQPGAWQQGTGPMLMLETGKAAAGRLLDGRLHDAYPEVR